jgi:Flp pilus assembly protein TadB
VSGATTTNALALLTTYRNFLASGAATVSLPNMRAAICSPVFVAAVVRDSAVASAPRLTRAFDDAQALRFAFADRQGQRAVDAKPVEIIAVTGGAGLFFGSVVAALSMKLPAIVLAAVPAFFGLLIAFSGAAFYRQIEAERYLCSDLLADMDAVLSSLS